MKEEFLTFDGAKENLEKMGYVVNQDFTLNCANHFQPTTKLNPDVEHYAKMKFQPIDFILPNH